MAGIGYHLEFGLRPAEVEIPCTRHRAADVVPALDDDCRDVADLGDVLEQLVRPEEAGPIISVRQPRGNSISGMPLGASSSDGWDTPSIDSNCFLRVATLINVRLLFAYTIFLQDESRSVKKVLDNEHNVTYNIL